jgi:hypothetical protein
MTDGLDKSSKPIDVLDPREREIYDLLLKKDDDGRLSRMFLGAVLVLEDTHNPDRYAQSANSIRCLADELMGDVELKPLKKAAKPEVVSALESLKETFESTLSKVIEHFHEQKDHADIRIKATKSFESLEHLMKIGKTTRIQKLEGLLGEPTHVKLLPDVVKKKAEALVRQYDYFTQVLHRHHSDEADFMTNWRKFQDFILIVLSDFFQLASKIDKLLEGDFFENE